MLVFLCMCHNQHIPLQLHSCLIHSEILPKDIVYVQHLRRFHGNTVSHLEKMNLKDLQKVVLIMVSATLETPALLKQIIMKIRNYSFWNCFYFSFFSMPFFMYSSDLYNLCKWLKGPPLILSSLSSFFYLIKCCREQFIVIFHLQVTIAY